jgi:hypothetical protein
MDEDRSGSKPGNARHLHRFELHKRVSNRLRRTDGVVDCRSEPSPFRPTKLFASVDGDAFGSACPDGDLEFEWRPRTESTDQFRIQFNLSDEPWSCGWHQDETHPERGACHFQIDHQDWAESKRTGVEFEDGLPMAVFEACLDALREHGSTPESILDGT